MANVSQNPGFYENPFPSWGVAATSIPLAGGTMVKKKTINKIIL